MPHKDLLSARVAGVNRANKTANELYPTLRRILEPLVGKKILKADDSLLVKIENFVPKFPWDSDIVIFQEKSSYSIAWKVQTREMYVGRDPDDTMATYHYAMVYVGNIRDGVLMELCKAPQLRTDYTVDAIVKAREVYRQAKKVADDAQAALHPFGE